MELLAYFQQNPLFFAVSIGFLGLLIGSFLNVVIYRLPIIIQREWSQECAELSGTAQKVFGPFSLSQPRSCCPTCNAPINALLNIPLISYLFLRGKCRHCKVNISIRYPLIEILTAGLSALVAIYFGVSWSCLAALCFTWSLITLTFIDVDHQLLLDNITLPLLWLGLFANIFGTFTDLQSAVIGALAGYLSLWLVYQAFKLITGKEGMGYGDFKLLAAIGAWLGWQILPTVIILSSLVGAIIGISLIVFKRHASQTPIPFGPYLAAAGFIALIWGQTITDAYQNWLLI